VLIGPGRRFLSTAFPSFAGGAPEIEPPLSPLAQPRWTYSTVAPFAPGLLARGHAGPFYFEAAAVIVHLIPAGPLVERARGRGSSCDPVTGRVAAAVCAGGNVTGRDRKSPRMRSVVGDIVIVRPGGVCPSTGTVLTGSGWVDEKL